MKARPSKLSGGYSQRDPPVPIPNTEVKPLHADNTWLATAAPACGNVGLGRCESRPIAAHVAAKGAREDKPFGTDAVSPSIPGCKRMRASARMDAGEGMRRSPPNSKQNTLQQCRVFCYVWDTCFLSTLKAVKRSKKHLRLQAVFYMRYFTPPVRRRIKVLCAAGAGGRRSPRGRRLAESTHRRRRPRL